MNNNSNKRLIFFAVFLAACILFAAMLSYSNEPISPPNTQNSQINNELSDSSIVNAEFNNVEIELEVAKSNTKKQKGLMFVEEMRENKGMIFVYPDEIYRNFWMKNTYISLDIIYLNKDLEVIQIHKNTKVNQTEETYPSISPAQYVVELNGGWSERNGLEVGSKLKLNS